MSRPTIVRFNFGKAIETSSASNSKKEDKKQPDELILVDAYWEKDGMKIRFIPHQMEVTLVVVFKFMHNDDTEYDKRNAKFELTFDSTDTIFSQKDPIIILGSDVHPLLDKFNNVVKDIDHKPYFYYQIEKFSPDFSNISF